MNAATIAGWGALPILIDEHLLEVHDWTDVQIVERADEAATIISAGADFLWESPPTTDGERVLDALATGIAILAQRPNGVTFHGRHWCTRHHDCPGRGELGFEAGTGTGVVYTPVWMAERITSDALTAVCATPGPLNTWDKSKWGVRNANEIVDLNIADIACGSGIFLLSITKFLSEVLVSALGQFDKDQARRLATLTVIKRCVYGIDIDPLAVDLSRLCLALLAPLDDADEEIAAHVICGDSLTMGKLDFAQFSDVVDRKGFDAVIGNPPYLGGMKITGVFGTAYRNYLVKHIARGVRGSADLAAYFALRSWDLVNDTGQVALVTTNTIAQGATREVGLDQIVEEGGTIWQAVKSAKWPTARASLEYAVVWISRAPVSNPDKLLLDRIPEPTEAAAGGDIAA